jgi:hypothetical protein
MRSVIYIVSQTCKNGVVNQFGFTNKAEAEKMKEHLNMHKSAYFKEVLMQSLVVSDDINDFIQLEKDVV